MVVPVPNTTSNISGSGVVRVRKDALPFFKVISFVAFGTISILAMSFALVRDSNTDFFSVEDPSI